MKIKLRCYNSFSLDNLLDLIEKKVRIFYNNVDFGVGRVEEVQSYEVSEDDVYKLPNHIIVEMSNEDCERLSVYVKTWADEGGVTHLEVIECPNL